MATETADVVIVGAGIVGASVAWHLAERGCRDVIVLERGEGPGEGSTGRATGGFRAQFDSEINVRLSLLARRKLLRFEEDTGVTPGYAPCGYLFLAQSQKDLQILRAALAVQRDAGLGESREIGPEEVAEINPHVRLEGIVGGTFCAADGFICPLDILGGYLAAAARNGVRVRYGESCCGIRVEGAGGTDRVVGVRTEAGEIATRRLVDAAGPWAAGVAALAGADLPVVPERRQVAVTCPFDGLPDTMPMTIFLEDGFHLRVREGRVHLLWPRESRTADPLDMRFETSWLDGLMDRAVGSVPCLSAASIDIAACRAGLYEMSPDHHAILGESVEVRGLYYANGSSGHGVMHAPALGQLLAEIILDGRATSIDVGSLRPSRFVEGAAVTGTNLL
ncbi:MAG: FAD-binding oxidoreductase [Gemmatimonadetes bacterium]|nr:FAD-binding oxidoreductase [Gemmatimonadota bacterium]